MKTHSRFLSLLIPFSLGLFSHSTAQEPGSIHEKELPPVAQKELLPLGASSSELSSPSQEGKPSPERRRLRNQEGEARGFSAEDAPHEQCPQNTPGTPKERRMGQGQGSKFGGGFGPGRMNGDMAQFILFHHLILEKYDTNTNGRIDPEEVDEIKKDAERFRKERHAKILVEFDLNKDGEIDDSERSAMRQKLAERLKNAQERRKLNCPNPDDSCPPPPPETLPNDKFKPEKMPQPPLDPATPGGSSKGKNFREFPPGAPHGAPPRGPRLPIPPEIISDARLMMLGHELLMEKFDENKDGKLSPEEKGKVEEFKRALIQKHKQERHARRADKKPVDEAHSPEKNS